MSERDKPPEGYYMFRVPDGFRPVGAGLGTHDTEPEAIAACWAHHDRITRTALERAREENCGWCMKGTPYSDGMHDFDGYFVPCDSLGVRTLLDELEGK